MKKINKKIKPTEENPLEIEFEYTDKNANKPENRKLKPYFGQEVIDSHTNAKYKIVDLERSKDNSRLYVTLEWDGKKNEEPNIFIVTSIQTPELFNGLKIREEVIL
jgi:hypothetical protein